MGLKVTGTSAVGSRLENVAKRSHKRALAEMRQGSKNIQESAQNNAPVDDGDLESAIEIEEDRAGINGRVRISVGVNEAKVKVSNPDVEVGQYAVIMHESTYNLGPKSQAKQEANPSATVGRKYLENAMEEHKDEIMAKMMAALKGSL